MKLKCFIIILLTIGAAAHAKPATPKKMSGKVLTPFNISNKKAAFKGRKGFFLLKKDRELKFNFKGPGPLKITAGRTGIYAGNLANPVYFQYSIDGKKRISKRIHSGKKEKVITLNPGIGHHTIKFSHSGKKGSIILKVKLVQKRERKREWRNLTPIGSGTPVKIEVKENVVKYYKPDNNDSFKLKVFGPGRIRFLSRLMTRKSAKKISYNIYVEKKKRKILEFTVSTSPSILASLKEKKIMYPVLWKSRNISFRVPQGVFNYTLYLKGSSQNSYLGRFIFSPSKSKRSAGLYSIKKSLITEEKGNLKSDKKKWRLVKLKAPKKRSVILRVKGKNRLYYRLDTKNPLRISSGRSKEIKLILRVENTFRMRGKIKYRIVVKRKGKLIGTYGYSSFPSDTVIYRDEKDKIPGRSRELVLKVTSLNDIFTILNPDNGKNILVRPLVPPGRNTGGTKKPGTIPVKISSSKNMINININGKKYEYLKLKRGKNLNIRSEKAGLIKLLIRRDITSGKKNNLIRFSMKNNGRLSKYNFKRGKAMKTSISGKKSMLVSASVFIPLKISSERSKISLIPDWKQMNELYVRIFSEGKNKIKVSMKKSKRTGKIASVKKLPQKKYRITKKTSGRTKINVRRIKTKRPKIRFSLASYYDSNILKYSDTYSDRFVEPLSKDDGRFNISSLDDLVINPSLRMEFPVNIIDKKESKIMATFSYRGYINNGVKNSFSGSLSIDQKISKRRILRLTFKYIPEIFIKKYRDFDLVSEYGYTPDTFQDMDISGKIFTLRFEQKLLRDMKIHLSLSSVRLKYNEEFTEYGSRDILGKLRVYKNLTHSIRVNAGLGYRRSDAKGYDEPGESKDISDEFDASFTQFEFVTGASIKLPEFFKVKNSIYLGVRLKNRKYLTLDEVPVDPYHSGRRDSYTRLYFSYTAHPSPGYSMSLFFNTDTRRSSRDELYEKVDLSLEKNYSQLISGLRIVLYF